MEQTKTTTKNTSISTTKKSRTSGTTNTTKTTTQATQDNDKHHNICEQANEQTPNKQYLQNLLLEYVQTKDINKLLYVGYVVVKKVCLKYAPNNTQTMQLYNDSRHPNTQNADIKDLRQVAIYSMLEQLHQQKDIDPLQIDYTQVFKNAFSGVNKYLYHLRGINLSCRPFDYSIEQLQENNIDILVNIRKGINELVKDSNITNINEYEQDDTNEQEQNTKKQLVLKILEQLTPTQKQIAKLLAFGLSQRQIASKLKRQPSTINEHIQIIRKKANNIINI